MQFSSIQELKREYSSHFDSFSSLLDKNLETHSDIYASSKELADSLNLVLSNTKTFQSILELNPELKVGNLINANMASQELYELSESQIPKGLISNILKLLEKLEKTENLLSEEKDEKIKQEHEQKCAEIFNSLREESTKLKLKAADFIKFLETAGNLEIKNNIKHGDKE